MVATQFGQLSTVVCYGDSSVLQQAKILASWFARGAKGRPNNEEENRIAVGLDSAQLPCGCQSTGPENWCVENALNVKKTGCCICRFNDEVCFVCCQIPSSPHSVEETVRSAYESTFQQLTECGGFTPAKFWNYLPNADQQSHKLLADIDTPYLKFCRARNAVFSARKYTDYCAATVVGTNTRNFILCSIATRQKITNIENPRQTSAYRYPTCTAVEMPSFARATLVGDPGSPAQLLMSATASIVQHETTHLDDAAGQTQEILDNLAALLLQASTCRQNFATLRLGDLSACRVYIRNRADNSSIANALKGILNLEHTRFFHAPMCRRRILLEIEAVASA